MDTSEPGWACCCSVCSPIFCDTFHVCVVGIFDFFLVLFFHDSNSMRSCVHSNSKASYSAATTRCGSFCSCRPWVWDGLWVLEALVVM